MTTHYDYWQQQDITKPLFSDLIWSQPQQKNLAGKLLIIGGNIHSIVAPAEAYTIAIQQNIGQCQVMLPQATRKILATQPNLNIEFADSTTNGSFSAQAENNIKNYMTASDATLFAGDLSRSSETAILLEKLIKITGLQIYVNDALDYFIDEPQTILQRADTVLVLSFAQLQKYAQNAHALKAFNSDMELLQLVNQLHELTNESACQITTEHHNQIVSAYAGQVISTKLSRQPTSNWQLRTATATAVWWLQNPNKLLAAAATAITQIAW